MNRMPLHTQAVAMPAKDRHSAYVWKLALTAALGGLLFGYDWVVIGGARQFYELYFRLASAELVGWANSCALLGCLIGSIAAGSLSSKYGRRPILFLAAFLFAVSSSLTGWAFSFFSFCFWRIVGGIAIGLSSNVSPLYIAEISPARIRGRLVSLNQFAIVTGILMAQIVNWLIAKPIAPSLGENAAFSTWNVQYGWRWMFTAVTVPSMVFAITSLFLPESPRWLVLRNRMQSAKEILNRIGGRDHAEAELQGIEQSLINEGGHSSSMTELLTPGVRKMLLVGITLAVLQQWSGINVLFNYAGDVFRSAGYGANEIFVNIVITGIINLVFSTLSMLLVDRIGRRSMMIFGCFGIGISHLLCFLAFKSAWRPEVVLALTLSAIACYAMTLAPVTWVLISEIFPNRVRSHGVSVSVSGLWIASFLLTYSFPVLERTFSTGGVFLTYGSICLLGCALTLWLVPETRGQSLEQIEFATTAISGSSIVH